MREQLDALVSELRRLRREGAGRVAVSESSLAALKTLAASAAAPKPKAEPVASKAIVPPVVPEKRVAPASAVPDAEPRREPPAQPKEKPLPAPPVLSLKSGDAAGRLAELGSALLADPVAKARSPKGFGPVVFDGPADAPALFLIHMPGADDAVENRLLSGAEGELYGKIVAAMGLSRAAVMTASLLPYRPTVDGGADHREPNLEEIAYFLPYLDALMETVRPKVVVALGGGAAEALLGKTGPISKARGVWGEWRGTPVMPTYHISYLIRNNTNKSKRVVWEDMLEVMARLRLPVSEKQLDYFK